MGNALYKPYDVPHGGSGFPHVYFTRRGQGDLHYAWQWLVYIAQNRNPFHSEPPSEYLIKNNTETLYNKHKDTEEFQIFVKWMGHIPV
jgi:hypothetical protein